jgi:hypothetical protein
MALDGSALVALNRTRNCSAPKHTIGQKPGMIEMSMNRPESLTTADRSLNEQVE